MEIQIIFLVLAFFQTLFPLFLTYRFLTRAHPSRWHLLITSVTLIFFFLNLYLNSPWHFIGLPWRYLLMVLMGLIVFRSLKSFPVVPKLKFGEPRAGRWLLILWIFFGAYQVRQVALIIKAHRPQGEALSLIFPLKGGTFAIGQGGADGVTNHHFFHAEQKHALDVVGLTATGLSREKFLSPATGDFVVFDKEVVAPCSGVIVKAQDGEEDAPPWELSVLTKELKSPYGNTLTLECGDFRVYLAHLKRALLSYSKERS